MRPQPSYCNFQSYETYNNANELKSIINFAKTDGFDERRLPYCPDVTAHKYYNTHILLSLVSKVPSANAENMRRERKTNCRRLFDGSRSSSIRSEREPINLWDALYYF